MKQCWFDVISNKNYVYSCKKNIIKGDFIFSECFNRPMKPYLFMRGKLFENKGTKRLNYKAKELFIERKK